MQKKVKKNRGSRPAPGGLYFDPDPSKSMYFHCVLAKIDQLWESISPQLVIGSFSNFKLKLNAYQILTTKNFRPIRARARA